MYYLNYTLKFILFTVFISLGLMLVSQAKVTPKNYDFSLDKLKSLTPGTTLKSVLKTYKSAKIINNKKGQLIYRVDIEHLRYKFPVFVQIKAGKVTDYYATMPSYFLHDVFHQSLINRLGPQDKYYKREESAIYVWENKNGLKHIYRGSCTITCFPQYYTVINVNAKDVPINFKPFYYSLWQKQEKQDQSQPL